MTDLGQWTVKDRFSRKSKPRDAWRVLTHLSVQTVQLSKVVRWLRRHIGDSARESHDLVRRPWWTCHRQDTIMAHMSLDPYPTPAELRAMAVRKGVLPQSAPAKPAPAVRPWYPYRSKWEASYAKHLESLRLCGRIMAWYYESIRLEIGVGAFYTPDFPVTLPDGTREMHEVKGYRRESGIVRIKAAAKQYPQYQFVLVTKKAGQWVHTAIGAKP